MRKISVNVTGVLVSVILLLAAFPDVFFEGASIRVTDQLNGSLTGLRPTAPYPVSAHTEWWSGASDTGGAAFQSEPMIVFVKAAWEAGDSAYWNPYSAAGSLGPEALVDLKFSIFTIANALMGGGSLVYNIVFIFGCFIGLMSVYLTAKTFFKQSSMAAAAASIFFLLNGYSTASLGSNVTLSFPYAALLLFSALLIIHRQTVGSLSLFTLSLAAIMSFTFLPTVITSVVGVSVIVVAQLATGFSAPERKGQDIMKVLGFAMGGVFLAMMIVSPIYLPIIENINTTGALEDYSKRIFFPIYFPHAIPSFFSPSLFFESYNAMESSARYFISTQSFPGNTVYHFGIVPILLISSVFSPNLPKLKAVYWGCLVLMVAVLGRLFDVPILSDAISYVPVIGNIGAQYWWPPLIISACFLVGYGVDDFRRRGAGGVPVVAVLTLFGASLLFVWTTYGLKAPFLSYKKAMLLASAAVVLSFVSLEVAWRIWSGERVREVITGCLLVLMFSELAVDAKMVRFPRNDLFSTPPSALAFVQKNIGLHRTLNFAQTGLYPELGSALGIQETSSTNLGVMPAYREFFFSAVALDPTQRLGFHATRAPNGAFPTLYLAKDEPEKNEIDMDRISFLGVKYILIPANYIHYKEWFLGRGMRVAFESPLTTVLENPAVLPRAFLVPYGGDGDTLSIPYKLGDEIQPTFISSYRNASVVLEGMAHSNGVAILTDAWHPGWRATVNGSPAPILEVGGAFRGIPVQQGPYRIEMMYRPRTLTLAQILSAGSLFLLAVAFGFRRKIQRIFSAGTGNELVQR